MVKIIHDNEMNSRLDSITAITADETFRNVTCTRIDAEKAVVLIIRMKDSHYVPLIKSLESVGVGVDFGVIDTYSAEATKPEFPQSKIVSKPAVAGTAIPISAMREQLWEACHMSLDYFVFIAMASIIAGCGLATDNSAFIVASMIISPLMGPLLAIIFGLITLDWKMVFTALLTFIMGTLLCIFCGFLIGVAFTPFVHLVCESDDFLCWPNFQIRDRGSWPSLAVGFFVSVASGAAASLAFTSGIIGTLVGVAISASLLPPVVNVGMMLAFGSFANFMSIEGGFTLDGMKEAFRISGVSFILFLMNDTMIILTGVVVLLYKRVGSNPCTKKAKRRPFPLQKVDNQEIIDTRDVMVYLPKSSTFPDFSLLRTPKLFETATSTAPTQVSYGLMKKVKRLSRKLRGVDSKEDTVEMPTAAFGDRLTALQNHLTPKNQSLRQEFVIDLSHVEKKMEKQSNSFEERNVEMIEIRDD